MADSQLFTDSYGEGMPFDMLDLAPELLGSATSYGRESDVFLDSSPSGSGYQFMPSAQEMHSPAMPSDPNAMPPPPPPPHPHSPLSHRQGLNGCPTPDVVAAASLLQNVPAGSHGANTHFHSGLDFGALSEMGPMGLMALGQPANQLLSGGQTHGGRRYSGNHGQQSHHQSQPSQQRLPKMRWGSDTSFNQPQGFVAQSASETLEAMSQGQLNLLGCLHVSNSAATTRPSSPATGRESPVKSHGRRASDFTVEVPDPDAPPRKRQKSRGNEDGTSPSSGASVPVTLKTSGRRRKTIAEGADAVIKECTPVGAEGSPGPGATPRARRRKSSGGKKPPRENLTEEQKRENHIRSEQKRRTVIKEGFAEISAIVPKLRGGGYSKSNMLQAAADWLEKLINSNKVLREELAKVGG